MDFRITDEQQQFADALRRWTEQRYSFEERRRILATPEGMSNTAWEELAHLGALALPIPEAHDGLGASALDLLPMLTELGRGLVAEPYQATFLGARFLALAGGHRLLAEVATGQAKLACALTEAQSRHDLADVQTTATASGEGYLLNGRKIAVAHGAQATYLIVSARLHGSQRERTGLGLFLVPADAEGLQRIPYRSFDGQPSAEVRLQDVRVPMRARLDTDGQAWSLLEAATDYGAALLCAEAIGLIEAVHRDTLEYLKTRKQFGVPIGSFQVLQHRMADMTMHLAQARSITILALASVDGDDADKRSQHVSAAKARVGKAMRYVGQQGVQLHGGMGMTNELAMAHAFKRMTAIELTLGDTEHHLHRFLERAQPMVPAHAQ